MENQTVEVKEEVVIETKEEVVAPVSGNVVIETKEEKLAKLQAKKSQLKSQLMTMNDAVTENQINDELKAINSQILQLDKADQVAKAIANLKALGVTPADVIKPMGWTKSQVDKVFASTTTTTTTTQTPSLIIWEGKVKVDGKEEDFKYDPFKRYGQDKSYGVFMMKTFEEIEKGLSEEGKKWIADIKPQHKVKVAGKDVVMSNIAYLQFKLNKYKADKKHNDNLADLIKPKTETKEEVKATTTKTK